MTPKEFVKACRDFIKEEPVYVLGMNGEIITPDSIEHMITRWGIDYKRIYYTDKLYGRGQRGADGVGMINYISKSLTDKTVADYRGKNPHPISTLPADEVALLFSNRYPTSIGVYMGDGLVARMKDDQVNGVIGTLFANEWNYWTRPSFLTYPTNLPPLSSKVVEDYQKWLTEKFSLTIEPNGYYDTTTKKATIRAIQMTLNKYYFCNASITGVMDEQTWNEMQSVVYTSDRDGYSILSNIVRVFLEDKQYYNISAYQASIRGIYVSGVIDSTTLFVMFKDVK